MLIYSFIHLYHWASAYSSVHARFDPSNRYLLPSRSTRTGYGARFCYCIGNASSPCSASLIASGDSLFRRSLMVLAKNVWLPIAVNATVGRCWMIWWGYNSSIWVLVGARKVATNCFFSSSWRLSVSDTNEFCMFSLLVWAIWARYCLMWVAN